VDVRDLAAWMLRCGEKRIGGAFVATSPPGSSTYGRMLGACAEVTGSDAKVAWVPDAFLAEQKVQYWGELPLWSAPAEAPNTWTADSSAAQAAGLVTRPIEETVAATWAWMTEVGVERAVGTRDGHGIDPAKEREVLAAWLAER
jgi:hypothetical protein